MIDPKMKEQALFYLQRAIRTAEEKAYPDQETMAWMGISYAERQKKIEEGKRHIPEVEALRWARDQLINLKVEMAS